MTSPCEFWRLPFATPLNLYCQQKPLKSSRRSFTKVPNVFLSIQVFFILLTISFQILQYFLNQNRFRNFLLILYFRLGTPLFLNWNPSPYKLADAPANLIQDFPTGWKTKLLTFVESPVTFLMVAKSGHYEDLQLCRLVLRGSAMPPESARGTTSRHNTDLVSRGPVVPTADKVGIVLYRLCHLSFQPHLEGLLLPAKNKKTRKIRPFAAKFSDSQVCKQSRD